ncbi:MAG: hypothetical protein J1F64_02360 [Oscillospiraceae bacterium]|nr:hypothetical protein [Oscillospiraceae bacterium]
MAILYFILLASGLAAVSIFVFWGILKICDVEISLWAHAIIMIVFTFADMFMLPVCMLLVFFAAMLIDSDSSPVLSLYVYIIQPVLMSIVPIIIAAVLNRRKYKYNEISKRDLIVSDISFSLIKIAVSLAMFLLSVTAGH